ncbi:MAG: hypothetical protein IMX02_06220 [Limnochordaceae bacterium]|nr:hypothetical protein [Limnochordaceae bacterium]
MPTFEQGLFAALFIIPGYVMLKVTSLTMAVDFGRSATDLLIRCLLLSAVSYVFSLPFVVWASHASWFNTPFGLLLVGIVSLFVVPSSLASAYIILVLKKGLLRRLLGWAGVPYNYPDPSAWDAAFRRFGEKADFVRVTLRSGQAIGGFFGRKSYAGNFPGPRDMFIELAYRMDDQGNLVEPLDGNGGVYIVEDEIAVVEFT